MKKETNWVREEIVEINPDALFLDGLDGSKEAFDDAIVGVAGRCAMPTVVVYDESKIIEILTDKYEMSYEDAAEWFSFNMAGAYMGENTPLFMRMDPY